MAKIQENTTFRVPGPQFTFRLLKNADKAVESSWFFLAGFDILRHQFTPNRVIQMFQMFPSCFCSCFCCRCCCLFQDSVRHKDAC